jgi:acetate kinase
MDTTEVLAKGSVDKIGMQGSLLQNIRNDGDYVKLVGEIVDHQAGIEYIFGTLISKKHGSISSLQDIHAVGHRVVHGGEKFKSNVIIDDAVISKIEEVAELAPLHNPPNLKGIYAIKQLLPDLPQVGVFDTAFHQSMPDYAYMYAIPYSLYKKYGLRRYGFHGTSHKYVSKRACDLLQMDIKKQKLITCHLGNGASISAVKNGKSVDTSMGLTPVEGMIMGTRSGDLDLGVLTFIMNKEEIRVQEANTLINKHSGLLGISGISSDMREVHKAAANGHKRAQLALKMYSYRIKKYIGAYCAAMNGMDAIIFTGGIGENDSLTRYDACKKMEFFGVHIDKEKNAQTVNGKEGLISADNSNIKLLVISTNEELVIAEETAQLLSKKKDQHAQKTV